MTPEMFGAVGVELMGTRSKLDGCCGLAVNEMDEEGVEEEVEWVMSCDFCAWKGQDGIVVVVIYDKSFQVHIEVLKMHQSVGLTIPSSHRREGKEEF